jgi:DNA-binding protein H-NS
MINPSTLDALNDDELRSVIAQSQGLLKKRDQDRKNKALDEARALLASVGLSPKDLNGKAKKKTAKAPLYKGGTVYQHPSDKTLVWTAKGQKPNWLRELEGKDGRAVEVRGTTDVPS